MPVTYGELDLNGHVNNVRYIEWILNHLPRDFHGTHRLMELEINFLGEALYGQTVFVCSTEIEPLYFAHAVKVGDMELVRARTAWAKKERDHAE